MNKQLLVLIFTLGLMSNSMQAVGTNDLVRAIKSRNADKFGKLLEQYNDIKEQNMLDNVKGLLSAKVDLYSNLYGNDKHFGKYSMLAIKTLFFYAVEMGKYSVVQYLLNNLNPDMQEPFEGNTPLMLAVDNSDYYMTYLLLTHGARADLVNLNGLTAFDIAKQEDKTPEFTMDVLPLLQKYRDKNIVS